MKSLRTTQSGFLAEFYQLVAWHAQRNAEMQQSVALADEHVQQLQSEMDRMKDAMERLNQVCDIFVMLFAMTLQDAHQ